MNLNKFSINYSEKEFENCVCFLINFRRPLSQRKPYSIKLRQNQLGVAIGFAPYLMGPSRARSQEDDLHWKVRARSLFRELMGL